MRRFFLTMMITLSAMFSAGCAPQQVEEEPQFLDVQLTISPEKAGVNEEIILEAKVTYGEEEVEDADEVKFEVWRSQAEEHEKVIVEHSENGIYRMKKSFEEEGTYYVIAHVTARSMHNMPKKEFVVGTPSEPESEDQVGSTDEQMDTDDHENGDH